MGTDKTNAVSIDDFCQPSKINSMKLIHLVRSNEALYNSEAEGYSDKNHKEILWERIHHTLFPQYATFDERNKEKIRTCVRRRWKTLRDAIAREVKKNATVENYIRKKESPMISELEFLIPHIRSAHCAKLADELGLRECYKTVNDTQYDEDDSEDLIDLTEEFDVKPIIKTDLSSQFDEQEGEGSCDSMPPQEALYPTVHMNTHDTSTNETGIVADWAKQFCTVGVYKEGEFQNSTVLCEREDSNEQDQQRTHSPLPPSPCRKRMRPDTDDPIELQAKILQLLTNLERRERMDVRADQDAQDEDRMFLLSLVSDLKRVPSSKKMLVKAEIANAIARSIQ